MSARPFVTVHVAQSLDGRLGMAGRTTLLSNEEGRRMAHADRADNEAVLVGAATVRIDDPRLTVREVAKREGAREPLRVVLSSTLAVPRAARIFDDPKRVLVIGAQGRVHEDERTWLLERGAECAVVAATSEGLVELEDALGVLAERGVKRLLVEGGARVVTSFLRSRLVDRMHVEIAMTLLGAEATPTALMLHGQMPRLANVSIERCGEHVLVRGDVRHG